MNEVIPRVRSCGFATARRTIASFEAGLWLRKGFGLAGRWTVRRQNAPLAFCKR
jgi:hypothetical protein